MDFTQDSSVTSPEVIVAFEEPASVSSDDATYARPTHRPQFCPD